MYLGDKGFFAEYTTFKEDITKKVEDTTVYKLELESTGGTSFTNGNIDTYINATLYRGTAIVTDDFYDSNFIWTRQSTDETSDTYWNQNHSEHQVVESAVVDGTLMYKTATGRYITGASSYVKFQEGVDTRITYSAHVQTCGNLSSVANGCVTGTIGESKRLEAITINGDVPIQYRAHVQTYGWQPWKTNGQVAGTNGESKRVEAIQIKRTDGGNIKYRVHMQGIGWGSWTSNGATAGTTGQSRRIEAIQIILE